jgi:transposase
MPEDPVTLKALLLAALAERDREQQRAEAQESLAREKSALAVQQTQRADDLYVQNLRLQLELGRYKKWYYGPPADRLQSSGELAQALLNFGEELEQKPVHPDDAAAGSEPASEGRRVKRRRGRRALASFENLPVTTQVYELSGKDRACPCCGGERQEIGTEESWQIEYLPGHFERIQHVRKKYACGPCESSAQGPQIQVAARAESPIERGLAGPGLLAASFPTTCRFTGWKRFSPARDSRLRGPRSRCGAGRWRIWRNPCTSAWPGR